MKVDDDATPIELKQRGLGVHVITETELDDVKHSLLGILLMQNDVVIQIKVYHLNLFVYI